MIKALYAAAAVLAMATPAMAQDTSPWDLRDRSAYLLHLGKMWSKPISQKGWAMMTKSARAVPKAPCFS